MLILGQIARGLAGNCAEVQGPDAYSLWRWARHCQTPTLRAHSFPGCFPSRNFLKSLLLGQWELTWGVKELPVPGQMILGYRSLKGWAFWDTVLPSLRTQLSILPHPMEGSGASCPAAHPHGGAASSEPLLCLALLKPVLQDTVSHDTKSSGDSVAQARSQRVLCFDLLFPPECKKPQRLQLPQKLPRDENPVEEQ